MLMIKQLLLLWLCGIAAFGAEGQPIVNYPRVGSLSTNSFFIATDQNRSANKTVSILASNYVARSQVSNVGGGASLLATGNDVQLKSLIAGSNVTITTNATNITIAATGGSGTNLSQILVNGTAIADVNLTNSTYIVFTVSGTNVSAYATNLTDALIAAGAAIARSKIAAGTASHLVINDGSGNLSSEATLGAARFPALTGDVATSAGSLTTTIQADSVALGTDTTGNYAAGDAEAGAALTGDSATAFFSAGTLEDARLPSSMADKSITGSLNIPNGAAPTTDATGELALDTTITDHQPMLQYYSGATEYLVIAIPRGQLDTTDGDVIKYSAANDRFEMQPDNNSGSATAFNDIGDTTAAGSVAIGHTNQWTFSLDGSTMLALTSTDADNASDTTLLRLGFYDAADANSIFMEMFSDEDGTPTSIYKFGATGFTSTVAGTFGTGNGQIDVGTAGVRITSDGDGAVTFLGLGDGSDEDFTMNLDDTANTVVLSSSTGVTLFDFLTGSFALSANTIELGNATANTLSASTGDLSIEGNRIFRVGGADVPVADGGTGLSSGTSGGILGFTASGTLASSAALTANAVVIGGGAGATPTTTTTGTGVLTGIGNTVNAAGGFLTTDGTATLTGKTYDAAGTGNVLKFTDYKDFIYPSRVDGTGCTIVTTPTTDNTWGLATYNGTADTNGNYAIFRIGTVPPDLDTAAAMTLKGLSIRVAGTDTDAAEFTIALYAPTSSAAGLPTDFTGFSTFINFDSGSLTSPASGDAFFCSDVTLTGWAAALTAGRPFIIGIARRNGANDDAVSITAGTIEYGRTK
jgi:hypothetical protein